MVHLVLREEQVASPVQQYHHIHVLNTGNGKMASACNLSRMHINCIQSRSRGDMYYIMFTLRNSLINVTMDGCKIMHPPQ